MTTVAVCTIVPRYPPSTFLGHFHGWDGKFEYAVHEMGGFCGRGGLDVYTKRPPSYEGGRMLLNEDYVLFVVEVIFFNDISILLPNIC